MLKEILVRFEQEEGMKRSIVFLVAMVFLLFAVINCGGQAETQEVMTPQEIARVSETTTLLDLEEGRNAIQGIRESLEQMNQEQLAEVLAAITLPEYWYTYVMNDFRVANPRGDNGLYIRKRS